MDENIERKEEFESSLSKEQLLALELLAKGMNNEDVAKILGEDIQIVRNWNHHDLEFEREIFNERRENWERSQDKLRFLVSKSVDIAIDLLKNGDERTKLEIVKIMLRIGGVSSNLKPQYDSEDIRMSMLSKAFKPLALDY